MSGTASPPRGLVPRTLAPRVAVQTEAVQTEAVQTEAAASDGGAVFWITLAAVLSQLTISSNLLTWIGIPYNTPGGVPPIKFHVGTYLAVLAVGLAAWRHRPVPAYLNARIAAAPLFPAAVGLMLVCAVYALVDTGMSGTAVYIESYAAACCLGLALEAQPPARRRWIGYAMLAAFLLNAVLCIGETALQRRLIPMLLIDPASLEAAQPYIDADFRGTALYDHPLTGAMMTMMGVFLCLATDLPPLRKACALGVLLVGLIPFGGRTAMAVTFLLVAGLAAIDVMRRLAARRMDVRHLAATLACLVLVPAVLGIVLFATPLGERIATRFYADDSATVRVVQWQILDLLDLHDWLYGLQAARLEELMLQIGLTPPENDIENFWLLVFLNLGIVGFAIWLGGFALMLARLWRAGGLFPRLILCSVIAVASTSNSLGRKSNVLFVCVAAVMTSAAFGARPGAAQKGAAQKGAAQKGAAWPGGAGPGGVPPRRLRPPGFVPPAHRN